MMNTKERRLLLCGTANSTPKILDWRARQSLTQAPSILLLANLFEQIQHVVSVLLFHGEYGFHQAPGRGIIISDIGDYFAVAVYGDPFSNQIFFDHVGKSLAFDIFCVAAH